MKELSRVVAHVIKVDRLLGQGIHAHKGNGASASASRNARLPCSEMMRSLKAFDVPQRYVPGIPVPRVLAGY